MPLTIAVVQLKGGTGRSTVATNLAGALAVRHRAVLVDGDLPQGTSSAWFAAREKLTGELIALGFEVLPSKANFIFARHPRHDAEKSALALRQRSIIVRHFKLPRIEQFLRITVGTDEQCAALTAALKDILKA